MEQTKAAKFLFTEDELLWEKGCYLLHLMACAIHEQSPQPCPKEIQIEDVIELAKIHYVLPVIYPVLVAQREILTDSCYEELHRYYSTCTAQGVYQQLAYSQLQETFRQKGWKLIPLKGILLKEMYPKPDMRIMSDLDLLYDGTQQKEVREVMEQLGYWMREGEGECHDNFVRKPYIEVEMHRKLFAEKVPYGAFFQNSLARVKEENGVWCFTKEDSYLHITAHFAKHYYGSGAGLRSLLDQYIVCRQYKTTFDWDYIQDGLQQMGLTGFERGMRSMAEHIFAQAYQKEYSHILDAFEPELMYLFACGSYGSAATRLIGDTSRLWKECREQGTRFQKVRFAFRRIVPSYAYMKEYFPISRCMLLLPVAWVQRILRLLLFRRQALKNELHILHSMEHGGSVRPEYQSKETQ